MNTLLKTTLAGILVIFVVLFVLTTFVTPPAAELLADYNAAAQATGVGWQYLAAVHLVETRMGRIRGTSAAGAEGPMQFLPSTFAG